MSEKVQMVDDRTIYANMTARARRTAQNLAEALEALERQEDYAAPIDRIIEMAQVYRRLLAVLVDVEMMGAEEP